MSLILDITLWIMQIKLFISFLKHSLFINFIVTLIQKINWYLKAKMLVFIAAKEKRYQTSTI